MDYLHSVNGELYIENAPLHKIAAQFGTPCYVYSRQAMEQNWQAFESAFANLNHLICYAVKANSNLGILNFFANKKAGFDIVSRGELERVLKAGGDPNKIIFSGVAKTHEEIARALDVGIFCFNVESAPELERIQQIAAEKKKVARIGLRINPNIDAKTHPYIATGLKENKFGIDLSQMVALCDQIKHSPSLKLIGIGCHIGSQLTELAPYEEAIECLLSLVNKLDIQLETLDLGGGLGISYQDETPPSVADYVAIIRKKLGQSPYKIVIEPGRSMIGNTGILLTRIEYLKKTTGKNFAIVDAGMNDLIRPALYQAWHKILPVITRNQPAQHYDIVGPVCESADFLGTDRELAIQVGDLLTICTAGAYGFSMSSNYNSRPRAAEVLVDGDKLHLLRARESLEDLYRQECIPL